jgi:hypothetical protein
MKKAPVYTTRALLILTEFTLYFTQRKQRMQRTQHSILCFFAPRFTQSKQWIERMLRCVRCFLCTLCVKQTTPPHLPFYFLHK